MAIYATQRFPRKKNQTISIGKTLKNRPSKNTIYWRVNKLQEAYNNSQTDPTRFDYSIILVMDYKNVERIKGTFVNISPYKTCHLGPQLKNSSNNFNVPVWFPMLNLRFTPLKVALLKSKSSKILSNSFQFYISK